MINVKSLLLIFLSVFLCNAGTKNLSGEVSGVLQENNYIINESIVIQMNDTLTINAGSHLYFGQYCQLEVFGTLICDGEIGKDIVFTSIKELKNVEKPKAMDWNGIKIYKNSRFIKIKNTAIKYSTVGIDIEKLDNDMLIQIQDVIFSDNGLSSLSIHGGVKDITENTRVFYKHIPEQIDTSTTNSFENITNKTSGVISAGMYVIDGVLKIPENDTLKINGGADIKFTKNSSIYVYGSLIIGDSTGVNVTLTSLYDNGSLIQNKRIPMAGDRFGVCVSHKAKLVDVSNCKIDYSTVWFNFEDKSSNEINFRNMNFGKYNGEINTNGSITIPENKVFYE